MSDGFCTCYDGEPLINQTCGIANHRDAARAELSRTRWVCGNGEMPLASGGEVPTQEMVNRLTRERDEARAALARVEAVVTGCEQSPEFNSIGPWEIRAAIKGDS